MAIEAADYVLMRSDLEDLLMAMDLSRRTFNRIRLNYVWVSVSTIMLLLLLAPPGTCCSAEGAHPWWELTPGEAAPLRVGA